MNPELGRRLSQIADDSHPIGSEALLDRVERQLRGEPTTGLVAPTPRRWRGWVVALASAGVAAAAIVGAVLVLGTGTEDLVTPPSVPPTAQPAASTSGPQVSEPTTTMTTTPVNAPNPWSAHRLSGDSPTARAVTATGSGFVAAGITFTRGDIWGRGAIWTSSDGRQWVQVGDRSLFEEGHFSIGAISSSSGVVVWGPNSRQGGTVIWHSVDGSAWTRIGVGDPPLDGSGATHGLGLDAGGYVLYGEGTRLLTSRDGLVWEQIDTPVDFTAIVQIDGNLLAAGGAISEPTTWISIDEGRTWELHGPNRSIDSGLSAEVWTMTQTPYGLVAAGVDNERRPMMWISEDGRIFTETFALPTPAERDTDINMISAIVSIDEWVIAVGSNGAHCCPDGVATGTWAEPAMWRSIDGRDWQEVPLTGLYHGRGGGLVDIVSDGSAVVAVGEDQPTAGGVGLVLRWEPHQG